MGRVVLKARWERREIQGGGHGVEGGCRDVVMGGRVPSEKAPTLTVEAPELELP